MRVNPENLQLAILEIGKRIGKAKVITETASLDLAAHDAWPVSVVAARRGMHPNRPDALVAVSAVAEIQTVLEVTTRYGVPVTPRGLASSVTGQSLPVKGGVLLDLSGLVDEPELNALDQIVSVSAGVRGSDIEAWLNQRGYTLNHFPQSLLRSTVGGWLATRATGQLSSKYGGIENLITGYRVVLPDGSLVDVFARPRAAVGPDLRQLFLGSEGALGVIVSVTLRIFRQSNLLRFGYLLPSVSAGLQVMREIAQAGLRPALVRFYDEAETRHAIPDKRLSGCALFLAFDDLPEVANAQAEVCAKIALNAGAASLAGDPVGDWLARRFDFSTVEGYLNKIGGYAETIEVAHMWSGIETLYMALRAALLPLGDEVLIHFSHVYDQGISLYVILLGQAEDDAQASARLDEIWHTAMEITITQGGELSHHHGAGLARQEYISRSLGTQHELLRTIKNALDPAGLLNPGKLGL